MMKKWARYEKQILFKPIGTEGQEKLLKSKAVIVGMGALGSMIANHLVRSGVGHIRMIDDDYVELSNLQRQMIYDEDDVKRPKVFAAERKLARMNPTVTIEPIFTALKGENAEALLAGFDVILDGTDNFPTRYLMNEAAVKLGIPYIYGGVISARGVAVVIIPGKTPCLRCLFPDKDNVPSETADTAGIISPIPAIIGSLEAAEALKLLTGAETTPYLEQVDLWLHSFMQIDIQKGRNPDCPVCVHHQFEFLA